MKNQKQKLLILGSGFASFSTLKGIDTDLYDVIVVSPRNHFIFTPLLPSTTVGTIEFRSIIEPIRSAKEEASYFNAYCTSIDLTKKIVQCKNALDGNEFPLSFDLLVIGIGAKSNTFGIEGVEEYALLLKELSDARAIRQRIIENFERASTPGIPFEERKRLLHFVIVGGGPTGVEFAAELHDFLTEDLVRSYPSSVPDVDITLFEAGDTILNTFDAVLRDYTLKIFQRQRISVRLHSQVGRVNEKELILKEGSHIPYGMLVWSTGNTSLPLVRELPFEKDRSGRIITDGQLTVKGYPFVYAVGDCAMIEGENFPAVGQLAQQEGYYLAKSLNHLAAGKPVKNFNFNNQGMLAYIGSNRALANHPHLKGKGFSTWIFWRSVYLTKLVSFKNKVLVLFDWIKAFFFGRDASRF
ncbi:MAG: FAD-dependent oxidoreductase [Bacteroidota bacterium]